MIEVKDRVPTHPGRVKLTPVSGQANTYDMERADEPIEVGTPINRALFQAILEEGTKAAKIATGSYTGAGTDSKTGLSMTFDFEPLFFIVSKSPFALNVNNTYWSNCLVWFEGATTCSTGSSTSYYVNFTKNGKTLSWKTSNSGRTDNICDASGTVYNWIAIGI